MSRCTNNHMESKKVKKFLEVGDVIKTNPFEGFWVCSLVLSSREKTKDFNGLCHIAVTNLVFTHDFAISEIDSADHMILHRENRIGITVPCINVYASRIKPGIEVIGNIDVSALYKKPLTFEIGDGSEGGWPSCGPVSKSIGFEAIHQWRSINDRVQWILDIKDAEKSHEEMLQRLKE